VGSVVQVHPDPPSYRGCSSVGRAPALQAGGHRFDPVHLHHLRKEKPYRYEERDPRLIRISERSQASQKAYFWSFDRRGCSLFNNSEEASASISQGRCTGCDCIQNGSSLVGRGRHKRENSYDRGPHSQARAQSYRVKRASAYGGCLGDHRRRRT
jgi:hypothetical protein